jgi:hypothetical protein
LLLSEEFGILTLRMNKHVLLSVIPIMKHCYRLYGTVLFCLCFILKISAQAPEESKFIAKVSQKNLQKNVRELVKFGNRFGGTKSGDKAAQYIFDKFKSYGFKPSWIIDPEKLTCSIDSWQLEIDQPKRLRGLIQQEWLAAFSPTTDQAPLRLIFVKSMRDIDESKIRNNAVLLDQHPAEKMYRELAEAGALCIVCYQNNISTSYSNWPMISMLKETEKNPIPVFNISNNAGQRLVEELGNGIQITIRYSSKTTIRPGNPKTIIATIDGRSDDYYILCAHGDSDSGGPGADDNASGVSGVLEIARIVNAMIKNKTLPLPKKSIKFIIWGTEYYSSSSYIKLHADSLKKISGVINFDEIGMRKSRQCIYFEGNDILHNQNLLKLFEQIGENYVDRNGFWKEATTNPSQGGTDSYVFSPKFLDRLDVSSEKIPSITVFTVAWNQPKSMLQTRGWRSKAWKGDPDSVTIDYSPFYHSSLDIPALTTDKVPSTMVWCVNAVGIALLRLLWQ